MITSLPVRMGLYDDGDLFVYDLARDGHMLLSGVTRSGKSTALYNLLGAAVGNLTARVVGIDPSRVLLAPLSGDPLVCLGTDPASVAPVARGLIDLLEERLALLQELRTDAIRSFTPGLPAVVVVLDELPGLFSRARASDQPLKPADRVLPVVDGAIRRLVFEGAKAGIRVVIAVQRPDAAIIGGDLRDQLTTRLLFSASGGDAIAMAFPNLDDPGLRDFVLNAPPGMGVAAGPSTPPRRFKGVEVSYEQYLAHMERHARRASVGLDR